jgi:hypothetical protein
MHQRKVIRDAVVAALTGTTDAGARVKATRVEPNRAAGLPALAIYTPTDETSEDSIETAPRELLSHVTLKVTGWVLDTAALPADDAMDALAEQVEAAMDVDRYFGGACGGKRGSVRISTETGVLDDGDPLVGVVTITYQADYYSSPEAPTLVNDYLRTGTTTQIEGTTGELVSDLFSQRP